MMKKIKKVLWFIAIIAVGLAAVSCTDPNDNNTTPNPCANGHNFGDDSDWVEDAIAATCTHPSQDTRDCKNAPCTEKDGRTGSHPALGHNLPGAKAATCMEDGNTGIGVCGRCGENETGETIDRDPDNHDFSGEPVITPATCTEDGEEVVNCGNGCAEKHETVLDMLGHEGTIQPFAATCTTAGNSDLSGNCVRYAQCGHVVTGTVIPINPDNHDWNSALETISEGVQAITCKRVGCNGKKDYVFQYAIGSTGPAGGKIFYVATDGITIQGYGISGDNGYFAEYTAYYLEAAPGGETASPWQSSTAANNTLIDGITTWADETAKNTGLAASIGVGRKDTQTIVNSAAFALLTNTAAQRCANKTLNGLTDWFLPSLGELNEMYKAKVAGVEELPTTTAWSSSQTDSSNAWFLFFSSGRQVNDSKVPSIYVRAIRAF